MIPDLLDRLGKLDELAVKAHAGELADAFDDISNTD